MFYEDTLIDGEWYWRGTPSGDWMLMGPARLTEKISSLTARCERAEYALLTERGKLEKADAENDRLQARVAEQGSIRDALRNFSTQIFLAQGYLLCKIIFMDTTHLIALQARLSHERARFAIDGSAIRKVWISQIEKEIAREEAHLGMDVLPEMSDDELLRELES
jgi:hypothetical protein